jgi:hypothetical protein
MKRLLFLFVLLFTVCSFYTANAQPVVQQPKLHVIELDKANKFFVNELQLDVIPGDSIQFKSVDGDFAIYIENAISFLNIRELDLKTRVNTSNPKSEIYLVRKVIKSIEKVYAIYCISNNAWPDAPPRIIIVSQ